MAFHFTDDNFEQEALNGGKVVLVDFWATWCAPCIAISPTIEALATEYAGKAVVGKLDVDNNQSVPSAFGIRTIPTILIFKDGQMVDKHIGMATISDLRKKIDAQLA
jgi:thioredoxin 1